MSPCEPRAPSQRSLSSTTVSALVEDVEDLPLVGAGVGLHLLLGELRAGGLLARGIADAGGEAADQEDHPVAELLEVPHLAQQHRVAQVEVGRGGVEAGLHGQRLAGLARPLELGAELRLVDQVDGAAPEQRHLLFDGRNSRVRHQKLMYSSSGLSSRSRAPSAQGRAA